VMRVSICCITQHVKASRQTVCRKSGARLSEFGGRNTWVCIICRQRSNKNAVCQLVTAVQALCSAFRVSVVQCLSTRVVRTYGHNDAHQYHVHMYTTYTHRGHVHILRAHTATDVHTVLRLCTTHHRGYLFALLPPCLPEPRQYRH